MSGGGGGGEAPSVASSLPAFYCAAWLLWETERERERERERGDAPPNEVRYTLCNTSRSSQLASSHQRHRHRPRLESGALITESIDRINHVRTHYEQWTQYLAVHSDNRLSVVRILSPFTRNGQRWNIGSLSSTYFLTVDKLIVVRMEVAINGDRRREIQSKRRSLSETSWTLGKVSITTHFSFAILLINSPRFSRIS